MGLQYLMVLQFLMGKHKLASESFAGSLRLAGNIQQRYGEHWQHRTIWRENCPQQMNRRWQKQPNYTYTYTYIYIPHMSRGVPQLCRCRMILVVCSLTAHLARARNMFVITKGSSSGGLHKRCRRGKQFCFTHECYSCQLGKHIGVSDWKMVI